MVYILKSMIPVLSGEPGLLRAGYAFIQAPEIFVGFVFPFLMLFFFFLYWLDHMAMNRILMAKY